MSLSTRLQTIFDWAQGPELWDIGCDHGLLAVANARVRKFQKVVCVDRSAPAIETLQKELRIKHRLAPSQLATIRIVCADGRSLDWSTVSGTVVMAGVGAHTLLNVVRSSPEPQRHHLEWILGPHNAVEFCHQQLQALFPKTTHFTQCLVQEQSRQRALIRIQNGFVRI